MIEQEILFQATGSACGLAAAVFDIKSRRVPNLLTGPAMLLALSMHLALGGWQSLWSALAAGLICGFIFFLFYLAGGMGAGDVKLMAAVGCFAGLASVPVLLVFTTLVGGAMALGLALVRGQLRDLLFNTGTIAKHHLAHGVAPHPEINLRNAGQLRLPYAVAIAAGCLLTAWSRIASGVAQ